MRGGFSGLAPRSVMGCPGVPERPSNETNSGYVPGITRMVSPGAEAFTARWIVRHGAPWEPGLASLPALPTQKSAADARPPEHSSPSNAMNVCPERMDSSCQTLGGKANARGDGGLAGHCG